MKKQIIAISLGLMSIGMFAQKKELRTIDKAINKEDFKTAKEGIAALESNESAIEEKYEAWYYYLKGSAYGKSNVEKAVEAYDKLFEIEKESGKSKYTDEAKPKLNELIQFVSNKAVNAYNNDKDSLAKDYEVSLDYYKQLQDLGYSGITTQYYAVNKETGVKENLGSKSQRDLMVKTGQYMNPMNENSDSKKGDIIKNISFILIAQGKTDEAIVAIKEARKNEPKDLNLLLNEAQLYIKLEKMDKFQELMEEAVQLDPKNPTLFFNLGVVNQNQGKTEEAIDYYKKAIELDPEYADAYMNLSVSILAGEQAIVEEMNKNLSNFKKYDELEKKQKALYNKALPYLEKADELSRTEDTVKSLLNIYDLTGNKKAETLRPIYKKMRGM